MLFSLVMDVRPPTSSVYSSIPEIPGKDVFIPLVFTSQNSMLTYGYDERYGNDSEMEERIRLEKLFYYYEQYCFLKTYTERTLEDVIKNNVVKDVLRMGEISPIQIRAGGLMDDWNREI